MRRASLLLIIFLGPLAGRVEGQRLGEPNFPSIVEPALESSPRVQARSAAAASDTRAEPAGTVWLVTGGVLAGAAAGFGGMYSGALLTQGDCEDCAVVGAVYGLAGGVSVGIPLGVHFTNGSRGNLLKSVAASLAIGGLGLGVALAADEPTILFGVPILQLASSITIERRTG